MRHRRGVPAVAAHEVVPETEAEEKAEKGDDEARKGLRSEGK